MTTSLFTSGIGNSISQQDISAKKAPLKIQTSYQNMRAAASDSVEFRSLSWQNPKPKIYYEILTQLTIQSTTV